MISEVSLAGDSPSYPPTATGSALGKAAKELFAEALRLRRELRTSRNVERLRCHKLCATMKRSQMSPMRLGEREGVQKSF